MEHLEQIIKILYDKADFLYEKMYEKQEKLKKIQDVKPKADKPKSFNKVGILKKMYEEVEEEKSSLTQEMKGFKGSIEDLGK